MLTVNPHLHRTISIEAVFPRIDAMVIDAAAAFAELLLAEGVAPGTPVLAPKAESLPWVEVLAARLGGTQAAVLPLRTRRTGQPADSTARTTASLAELFASMPTT